MVSRDQSRDQKGVWKWVMWLKRSLVSSHVTKKGFGNESRDLKWAWYLVTWSVTWPYISIIIISTIMRTDLPNNFGQLLGICWNNSIVLEDTLPNNFGQLLGICWNNSIVFLTLSKILDSFWAFRGIAYPLVFLTLSKILDIFWAFRWIAYPVRFLTLSKILDSFWAFWGIYALVTLISTYTHSYLPPPYTIYAHLIITLPIYFFIAHIVLKFQTKRTEIVKVPYMRVTSLFWPLTPCNSRTAHDRPYVNESLIS